ncbi:MAG: toxin [Nitrospirae bacterium]|nr:toxin [Nitrospirota bacterium]
MIFNWDNKKNEQLKKDRNVSFEQVLVAIDSDKLVDILDHPNTEKYPNQVLILVTINEYVYAVPTVIKEDEFFLKTIYPGRKYTERYLGDKGR